MILFSLIPLSFYFYVLLFSGTPIRFVQVIASHLPAILQVPSSNLGPPTGISNRFFMFCLSYIDTDSGKAANFSFSFHLAF